MEKKERKSILFPAQIDGICNFAADARSGYQRITFQTYILHGNPLCMYIYIECSYQ